MNIAPAWLSIKQFASYISVSTSTVEHNWEAWKVKYGIKTSLVGNRRRFRKVDIDRMMESGLVETKKVALPTRRRPEYAAAA